LPGTSPTDGSATSTPATPSVLGNVPTTAPNAPTQLGASSGSGSGSSPFQNKSTVIGLSVAAALVVGVFLIYIILRLCRQRRRRELDREMDLSFEETMKGAASAWHSSSESALGHGHSDPASLQRAPSAMSTASAGAYGAAPMAVKYGGDGNNFNSDSYNYNYDYNGAGVAQPQPPPAQYWAAPQPLGMGMGMRAGTNAQPQV
jgi:preprotein translocase subunit SecG